MILLKEIAGHDEIIRTLTGALVTGRVSHAYLFSGPQGVGKMTTALSYGRALLCEAPQNGDACGRCDGCSKAAAGKHPDITVIEPQGTTLKISQIRDLAAGIRLGPAVGRWAIRIIDRADTMTQEAANALLKNLEDPQPGIIIILVSSRPQVILPTILSRCQHMYFQPLLKSQVVQCMIKHAGITEEEASAAASLSGGSPGKAMEFLSGGLAIRDKAFDFIRRLAFGGVAEALTLAGGIAGKKAEKEEAALLLDMMILWLRDVLLYNEKSDIKNLINADRWEDISNLAGLFTTGRLIEMISGINNTRESLSGNANMQLAVEALFLSLAGN